MSLAPTQCFHLPKHVCACRTDDGIVFLDTRHDRYFGLGGECASALVNAICNWPGHPPNSGSEALSLPHELREVANALIERGLLAQGDINQIPNARALVPRLAMRSPTVTATRGRAIRLIDVAHFLTAYFKAAWLLQRRSLEFIESSLSSARQRVKAPPRIDVDGAVELAWVFFKLRRWVFSEKNRCLLNALSLVYFLRYYGYYPHFVVGVKTGPFAAHSWVQQEHLVLDGEPASVCHFVPILVA